MPSAVRQSVIGLLVPEADILGQLTRDEIWWRDNFHQLEGHGHGYWLRRRHRPGWRPSWREHPNRHPSEFEDWHRYENTTVVDARRRHDQRLVFLKRLKSGSGEFGLIEWLNSSEHRRDPENHTVPLLDRLHVDDSTIAIMPLLRPCDDPAWDTVGEVVSFLKQVFEGVKYMHEQDVAHRDIKAATIMYDPRPMYPYGFHPLVRDKDYDFKGKAKRKGTRTDHPVRYYFVSFSSAKRYEETTRPREYPRVETSTGELERHFDEPRTDPFMFDIKCLGKLVRTTILMKYRGLSFLAPLVKDMLQDKASKRPTAADVVRRFDALEGALTERQLRARLVPAYEGRLLGFCRGIRHRFRMMRWKRREMDPVPLLPQF